MLSSSQARVGSALGEAGRHLIQLQPSENKTKSADLQPDEKSNQDTCGVACVRSAVIVWPRDRRWCWIGFCAIGAERRGGTASLVKVETELPENCKEIASTRESWFMRQNGYASLASGNPYTI